MTFGLTGDQQSIKTAQFVQQGLIDPANRPTSHISLHLRTDRRVILGQYCAALHLELRLAVAGNPMEKKRLFERRHQRVANAAQHRMIGPDSQRIMSRAPEPSSIVQQIFLHIPRLYPQRRAQRFVESPHSLLQILQGNLGVGRRMVARRIHKKNWMKNLSGLMGVQGRKDLGHQIQISIDELAQPPVVVYGPQPRTPCNKKFKSRNAEGILHIHRQQCHPQTVCTHRMQSMAGRPGLRFQLALGIIYPPDLPYFGCIVVGRQRQCVPHRISSHNFM